MFAGVNVKLGRASYFLNRIKTLQPDISNFAVFDSTKEQEFRANLDGFLFEIVSAKDFFLQGINDNYRLDLKKHQATDTDRLIHKLKNRNLNSALNVVTSIKGFLNEKNLRPEQKLRDDQDSWLWRLNHYRNSAMHREVLMEVHNIILPPMKGDKSSRVALQFPGQVVGTSPGEQKVDVPEENLRICLLNNPEDPLQGQADIEVIPYCEQSLTRMKELLERLYSELELE